MSEKEYGIVFSKNLVYYMNKNDITQAALAKKIGVTPATISNWCNGIKLPRMDKVDALANYFGIQRSDLMVEKNEQSEKLTYSTDEYAREVAEFLHKNPDYKVLFDASRKVKKEDIEFVKQMLDRFSN